MRKQIVEYVAGGGAGLHELALEAVKRSIASTTRTLASAAYLGPRQGAQGAPNGPAPCRYHSAACVRIRAFAILAVLGKIPRFALRPKTSRRHFPAI